MDHCSASILKKVLGSQLELTVKLQRLKKLNQNEKKCVGVQQATTSLIDCADIQCPKVDIVVVEEVKHIQAVMCMSSPGYCRVLLLRTVRNLNSLQLEIWPQTEFPHGRICLQPRSNSILAVSETLVYTCCVFARTCIKFDLLRLAHGCEG